MHQPINQKDPDETVLNPNQNSQGILTQGKPIHGSQGTLATLHPHRTAEEKIEQVSIDQLTHYDGIDDFIEPSTSIRPIVIKTPNCCYVIEGYEHVEQAIKNNKKEMTCHTYHIPTDSESEIALRKATIRMASDRGFAHFSEIARNAKKLKAIFMETLENPISYSHGGKRKGISYNEKNREENVRMLLAERFGKSKSTINKYLNYTEHLNNETIEVLVQSKTTKKFYEAAASNKRRLIKNCAGQSEAEITAQVSEKMLEWLQEFNEKGNIKPEAFETTANQPAQSEATKCSLNIPVQFQHHEEYAQTAENQTRKSIRSDLLTIFEGLGVYIRDEKNHNGNFTVTIKHIIGQVATCLSKYDSLPSEITLNETQEVA